MTAGSDIAAEIEAALIEAAEATGSGILYATLEKQGAAGGTAANPTPGTPTKHTLTVVQDQNLARDATGAIGQVVKSLLVAATGTAPEKADRIAVGYVSTDTIPDAAWVPVEDVVTTAPGGEALLYEVLLSS